MHLFSLLPIALVAVTCQAQQLQLAKEYIGQDFETDFSASTPFVSQGSIFDVRARSACLFDRPGPYPANKLPALHSHLAYFTDDDPTNGFVDYVSHGVGTSRGLVVSNATHFRMGVDDTTEFATGRGRKSVRIHSNDQWGDGVYVLDVDHIPVGCGTVR